MTASDDPHPTCLRHEGIAPDLTAVLVADLDCGAGSDRCPRAVERRGNAEAAGRGVSLDPHLAHFGESAELPQ